MTLTQVLLHAPRFADDLANLVDPTCLIPASCRLPIPCLKSVHSMHAAIVYQVCPVICFCVYTSIFFILPFSLKLNTFRIAFLSLQRILISAYNTACSQALNGKHCILDC